MTDRTPQPSHRLGAARSRLSLWLLCSGLVGVLLAAGIRGGQRFEPAGSGLRVECFADADASTPVPAVDQPRPSTAGIRDAWLGPPPGGSALVWSGAITVLRGGHYTFATTSDTGSWLYLDRRLVVDNGGSNGPRTMTGGIDLAPGTYPFLLRYTHAGEGYRLSVQWARNQSPLSDIPAYAFRHRSVGLVRALWGTLLDTLSIPAAVVGLSALILWAAISLGPVLGRRRSSVSVWWLTVPAWMCGIAAFLTWRLYSPVPFYDEWEASLPFVMDVQDGVHAAWWAQYNEHRLLLTRLLLYPILVWFGGRQWLLSVIAFALIAAGGWLFWRLLGRATTGATTMMADATRLGCIVTGWLFLWSQRETLAWGFNIAFVFAMVMPIAALSMLVVNDREHPGTSNRVWAALVGACAVGSMANGVLALPCLAFFAWWQRLGWRTTAAYTALSLAGLAAYLHGYVSVEQHGPLLEALATRPLAILHFIVLFLGAPFRWLVEPTPFANLAGFVTGAAYVAIWIWMLWVMWRERGARPVVTALWLFAGYVLGTATVTGIGRTLVFGAESALWSRYTTAAAWGWAALLVLVQIQSVRWPVPARRLLRVKLVVLAVLMSARQLTGDETGGLFTPNRNVPALAVAMQVRDVQALQRVFPSPTLALTVGARAMPRHLSVFGSYPFRDLREQLGTPFPAVLAARCAGALTDTRLLEEGAMLRVRGWLLEPRAARRHPRLVRIVSDGATVGFAVDGQVEPSVGEPTRTDDGDAGITGYLPVQLAGRRVVLVSDAPECGVDVAVPLPGGPASR